MNVYRERSGIQIPYFRGRDEVGKKRKFIWKIEREKVKVLETFISHKLIAIYNQSF